MGNYFRYIPPRIYTHTYIAVSADKIFPRAFVSAITLLCDIYMYICTYTRAWFSAYDKSWTQASPREERGGATVVEKTRTRGNARDKRSVENYTGIFDRVSTGAFIVPKCLAHRSKSCAKHRITISRYESNNRRMIKEGLLKNWCKLYPENLELSDCWNN